MSQSRKLCQKPHFVIAKAKLEAIHNIFVLAGLLRFARNDGRRFFLKLTTLGASPRKNEIRRPQSRRDAILNMPATQAADKKKDADRYCLRPSLRSVSSAC
jgi:hypothetical protein